MHIPQISSRAQLSILLFLNPILFFFLLLGQLAGLLGARDRAERLGPCVQPQADQAPDLLGALGIDQDAPRPGQRELIPLREQGQDGQGLEPTEPRY